MHVLIVLAPFILLPVAGWLGGRGKHARLLAVAPAALTGYFIWLFGAVATSGPSTVTVPWAPRLGLALAFHFDGLGLLFALLITGIGTLIVLYAVEYLGDHPLAGRFHLTLFAFMGSMLGVVLSDNILLLFVFWELTGLTSYFLIAFDHERAEARKSALQALLVTGGGGLALLAAGVLIWQLTGTVSLSELRAGGSSLASGPAYTAVASLVLLAAFTKSAQYPFHFWLPNAMEAPTPVSGYLHSATMVKAGIYLIARTTPLLGGTGFWTTALVTAGAITMIGAAFRSLLETDLKRILAYSTISALGAMVLLLGVGTREAVVGAIVYLLAHAGYKGALFLMAGAVDHETGTRDVRALSGLRRAMPKTAAAGVLAALSMMGIPPLFGFLAKEQLYEGVAGYGTGGVPSLMLLVGVVVASAMLGASALAVGFSPFYGSRVAPADVHDAPGFLWLAPLMLAGFGLVAGLDPFLLNTPLSLAADAITGAAAEPVELALWHGVTPALLLSALTIAITLALYRFRSPIRDLLSGTGLRTERLYTGTIAGLDLLSARVSPVLQSAPLRWYVRWIVATTVGLLLATYAFGDELPRLFWRTPVRLHELGVAILIMAGAIGATRAKSAMPAVLSLGTVGYGIALLYVLYGAPDLAATQFAVETLTVVLFVLVFYQFRGFDDMSSPLGRVRDAILAGAAGGTIALLVLVTAAGGITSRLSDWFVEASPALAHGRNVVNVILVDFRAFDTMGEITVLVTVAIGVRALFGMGKERSS